MNRLVTTISALSILGILFLGFDEAVSANPKNPPIGYKSVITEE